VAATPAASTACSGRHTWAKCPETSFFCDRYKSAYVLMLAERWQRNEAFAVNRFNDFNLSARRRLKCSAFLRECPSAVARLLGHLSNLPGTLQPRAFCSWNLSRRWPGLALFEVRAFETL